MQKLFEHFPPKIVRALSRVPLRERIVFELFAMESLPEEAVAAIVDMPSDEVPRVAEKVRRQVLLEIRADREQQAWTRKRLSGLIVFDALRSASASSAQASLASWLFTQRIISAGRPGSTMELSSQGMPLKRAAVRKRVRPDPHAKMQQ